MIKKEEFLKELQVHKTYENYCNFQLNEKKKRFSNFNYI